MASRSGLFSSSVGTKILIGITGVALVLYLLIHIAGNMMVFLGPAAFNKYAYTLEGNPLLPIIEIGLLLVFLIHIFKTVRMYLGNQGLRPVRYARKKYAGPPSRKTVASSTMIVSGLWLVAFLIIHVKTFRFSEEQEWPAGAFQSLGLDKPAWTRFILPAGKTIAVLIAAGFIVIAVWAHFNGVRS
jgi:succinate dehydrogenase / fumarate reductase cytochrome b subunit